MGDDGKYSMKRNNALIEQSLSSKSSSNSIISTVKQRLSIFCFNDSNSTSSKKTTQLWFSINPQFFLFPIAHFMLENIFPKRLFKKKSETL
jgi:hypothetical protein